MKYKQTAALVGYGYWGKKLAQVLKKFFSEIVVVDPKLDHDFEGLKACSLEDVLSNDDIKHCFIATPEETHFKLVSQCLSHDKSIFVEKPLSLNRNHAQRNITQALEEKRIIFVDYIFLYDPVIREIKEILDDSLLGKVKQVASHRWSKDFYKPNITITDDLLIHDLYISRFLFGNYEFVGCTNRETDNFSESVIKLIVGNNIPYISSLRWTKEDGKRDLKIIGSDSTLIWERDSDGDNLLVKSHTGELISSHHYKKKISPLDLSVGAFLEIKSGDDQHLQNQYNEYLIDCHTLEIARETNSTF